MLGAVVAAEQRDLLDAQLCMGQVIPGTANPAFNDIVHAGDAELPFVQQVQITSADVQPCGHFGHVPVFLRLAQYIPPQGRQLKMIVGVAGQIDAGAQLLKQQLHQLGGDGLETALHVLPGEQLEQIVAVICVRHGEGTVLQRKLGDIGLVGVKDDPIIAIGRLARAIVDASVGGEQSRVAGGIDALAVAVPKAKGRVGEYEQVIAVPPGMS